MSALQAIDLRGLRTHLGWAATPRTETPLWSREHLAGRLCELSSRSGAALLTSAFRLVLDAQMEGEPVAWVAAGRDTFFAPDAAENGVDLNALVVVRVPDSQSAGRAADRLLRSGAFGLVVMDLNFNPTISVPLQVRLAQQARASGILVPESIFETNLPHDRLAGRLDLSGAARWIRSAWNRPRTGLENFLLIPSEYGI